MIIYFNFFSYFFGNALAGRRSYTVGVESVPFMPYSEVEKHQYRGILRDILDGFAEEAGVTFIYKPLPISRLYSDFYNKKLDFKMPANEYWQKEIKDKRKLNITYSETLVPFVDGLLLKAKHRGKKIEDIKRIGVVSGFTPWEYLERIRAGKLSFRENPSILGLLEQGLLGRYDAIYVNVLVGKFYLQQKLKQSKELVFAQNLPHTKSTYHVATLRYSFVIEKINAYLKKNKKKISLLKRKYNLDGI